MMGLSAEYFDAIQIDVVKRKYYNANKVNAVFEDIRVQVLELLEENERLRQEIGSMKKADAEMLSLPQVYRETLQKGRERAEAMEHEVREEGERIRREYDEKQKASDKFLTDCIRKLRIREEENLNFLEAELKRIHGETSDSVAPYDLEAPADESAPALGTELPEEAPSDLADAGPDLDELERRIGLLASEIRALEDENSAQA